MLKEVKFNISQCVECPFAVVANPNIRESTSVAKCVITQRIISDIEEYWARKTDIPNWCPLPDIQA